MFLAVSLGLTLGVVVLITGIVIERRDHSIQARLARYAQPSLTLEEMELQLPISDRLIMPAMQRLVNVLFRMTPSSQIALTRHNLMMAGLAGQMTVAQFQSRRFMAAFLLGGGMAFYGGLVKMSSTTALALGLPLAALGYLLPSMWLGSRIRSRQEAIQKSLADAIDLLTVCVEAGSGFDAALARVVARWKGPLADEFDRLLADLRMGKARREALKELADRTGVEDVQSFVSALIQADLLGVGLVKVLRVQAEQMRQRRRLRAEEQAQKAGLKMLFPLIFMIFPAVYIVILGPAVIQLFKVFGG
jgi:tight adherence protein C